MLRTTIDTRDEKTGEELTIPAELRARVQRADDILRSKLRKVGERFDIGLHWRLSQAATGDVGLVLAVPNGPQVGSVSVTCSLPVDDLRTDEGINRALWKPIDMLIPILSEEVDRQFERIRRELQEFVAAGEG